MKISPRVTFSTQMIACVWFSIMLIAVMNWALSTIKDACSFTQPNSYTLPQRPRLLQCLHHLRRHRPSTHVLPGPDLLQPPLVLPHGRPFPHPHLRGGSHLPKHRLLRFLYTPLILGGAALIPSATPLNYLSWGVVGFIFNKLIRDRSRGWWMQYNYVLSAELDVGLTLYTISTFLTLNLTRTGFPSWWRTRIAREAMDAKNTAVQILLPEGEMLGPAS